MDSSSAKAPHPQTLKSFQKFKNMIRKIAPGYYFDVHDWRHRLLVRIDDRTVTLETYFVGYDTKDFLTLKDWEFVRDVRLDPIQDSFENVAVYLDMLLNDEYRSMQGKDFSDYVLRSPEHHETITVDHGRQEMLYSGAHGIVPLGEPKIMIDMYDGTDRTKLLLTDTRHLDFECLLPVCDCGVRTLPPIVHEADEGWTEITCPQGRKLAVQSRQILSVYDEDRVQKDITYYNSYIYDELRDCLNVPDYFVEICYDFKT